MAKKVRVTEDYVQDIADSIRVKLDSHDTYNIKEMAPAIDSIVTGLSGIVLRYASDINTAKSVEEGEANIRTNAAKCSVTFDGNAITVKDEGLIEYVGGPYTDPKKWVGLLVDLNVKAQGDIYNIEEVDYNDAKRWGAANNTTFVMWITPDISGREITFTNTENSADSVKITINFTE